MFHPVSNCNRICYVANMAEPRTLLDVLNAAEGRRILDEAAIGVVEQVDTMDGAARRAAELAAAAKGA